MVEGAGGDAVAGRWRVTAAAMEAVTARERGGGGLGKAASGEGKAGGQKGKWEFDDFAEFR